MNLRILPLAATIAVASVGCYATVHRGSIEVGVETYEPEVFDDHVVYYDGSGTPFYYEAGVVVYVPQTHPRYRVLTDHYRVHRDRYNHWYQRDGHRRYERRHQVPRRR